MCIVIAYLERFLGLTMDISNSPFQKFQNNSITQVLLELELEVKKRLAIAWGARLKDTCCLASCSLPTLPG